MLEDCFRDELGDAALLLCRYMFAQMKLAGVTKYKVVLGETVNFHHLRADLARPSFLSSVFSFERDRVSRGVHQAP